MERKNAALSPIHDEAGGCPAIQVKGELTELSDVLLRAHTREHLI